jgi:transposase
MGTARVCYNEIVAAVNQRKIQPTRKQAKHHLSTDEFKTRRPWLSETPFNIRGDAAIAACKAFDSNMAKKDKNPNHKFSVSFKRKKDVRKTISIQHQNIRVRTKGRKVGTFLFPGTINTNQKNATDQAWVTAKGWCLRLEDIVQGRWSKQSKLPPIEGEVTITRYHDKFSINIPYVKVPTKTQHPTGATVAIDPGDRNFATFYSPEGSVGYIGNPKTRSRIMGLCKKMDKAISDRTRWAQHVLTKGKTGINSSCCPNSTIRSKPPKISRTLHS